MTVETGFAATHQLRLSDGSKEKLHSHDWKVIAEVCSEKLNRMGLVMDFGRLKAIVDEVSAGLAGRIEDNVYFAERNSSAEHVAEYSFGILEGRLSKQVRLKSVSVMEENGCWGRFER